MTTNEKLDKDRFRRDLGGEAEAYQEVARRLGLLPEGDDERGARPRAAPARSAANRTSRTGARCAVRPPVP